ncbi:hypothetical protein PC128_g19449 [Phytophthora cactorum]|nr:hypothetical protein PC128_g19449 [Phytophthora cactorum]
MDRLAGVTTTETAQALSDELSSSSTIRQCVLEVVRPICGTRRIVNSNNYYTSVQLLEALKVKGLYARGTVQKSSAHFPRHVLIEKKECSRGSSRQAVSSAHSIVAASWFDSAIVSVISNADASTLTTVERQMRAQKRTFSAPTCVKQYNTYKQGVDRLDQIRGRFSVADGHSFKKRYKKLGLALVDVARANAFLTRKLAVNLSGACDPHRDFIVELISERFTGKWKEAPSERFMLYSEDSISEAATAAPPVSAVWTAGASPVDGGAGCPQKRCSAVSSKQLFKEMSRKRRQFVVCRWEGRYATEVTDYCVLHGVSLYQVVHSATSEAIMCPRTAWTCWDKFHRYYQPRKLFSSKEKVRTSSALYKLKQGSSPAKSPVVRALNVQD